MTEQWQELKETIIEMRDNNGTSTQQEVCKFLVNLMDVLEKQMSDGWIPKNATNGDVIKALFPNFRIDEMSHTVWVGYDDMSFRRKWWEAPYEKENI